MHTGMPVGAMPPKACPEAKREWAEREAQAAQSQFALRRYACVIAPAAHPGCG
jgi:hypothetical protein